MATLQFHPLHQGYQFSRCSYVLSLLRPQIFKDLDLKGHGLQVYLRNPGSYTPILPEYQADHGPTSLTIWNDPDKTRRQIEQFSKHDSIMFAKYEHQLAQFVDVIDPLLDSAPKELMAFRDANFFKKLTMLRRMKEIRSAAKAATKCNLAAFYELVTAPSSKVRRGSLGCL